MKSGLIVSVVDIGSTKVACCIAGISKEGKYSIISAGYCACFGVKSGVIVDAESVSKSIAKAIEIAENAAGLRIKSVYVNVSGKFVRSKIITASMNIGGRLIRRQDITDLLSMCLDKIQSMETIHIIPVMFKLDELNGVNEPVGMFANSLSVNANVVSAPKTQLANIVACLSKCHLDVIGFVHGGYASSLHVMNEDLSTDNQVVIDLGGGTSTINFFYKGVFCGSEVISLGGQNITKDIAYGLKISKSNAERLKTLHGSAFVSYDDDKNSIITPTADEDGITSLQQLPRSSLNQIIQPRVEEIWESIKQKITGSDFTWNFSNNILITGGGSMLIGMQEFASDILKKNVKMKRLDEYLENSKIQINNEFATCVGMIKFAMLSGNQELTRNNTSDYSKKENFFKRVINWLENNL